MTSAYIDNHQCIEWGRQHLAVIESAFMPTLTRRLLAEYLGSALLACIVIGSGIAAQTLSPGDVGLQLLENTAATAVGLYVLIQIFGPISGAHFNPLVSGVSALSRALTWSDFSAYLVAQVTGCCSGAILANVMFSDTAVSISAHQRATGAHLISEVVASAGLMLTIFSLVRSGRSHLCAAAVACYIGAAYFFTSSTSFANPAITVGRMLSRSFAGIAPTSAPAFIVAQIVGAVVGWGLVVILYPATATAQEQAMSESSRRPEILFLCVHNAGRSQMAAGFARELGGDRVVIHSAGTAPGESLNPAVVDAMLEVGIDIREQRPQMLTEAMGLSSDVIITMGCGDSCPVYIGKRYLDWPLVDPAGKSLEDVREIRDDVRARVVSLLEEILDGDAKS